MKIVSVREGSTVIVAVIQTDPANLTVASSTPTNPGADQAALNQLASRLSSGIGNLQLGGALLSHSTTVYTFNLDGSEYVPPK